MASIQTRSGPKGTSFRVTWREDGSQKVATYRSEEAALNWKRLIEAVGSADEADRILEKQNSTSPTVDEVAEHRLELLRATRGTKATYRQYMRTHISPAFGSWPVDTVSPDDCRRFVIALENKGRAPKMIHNICGWLTSLMLHAEERGWRSGNPMKADMLPPVERSDATEASMFLTKKEADAIISRVRQPYQDFCLLMLSTGMRPSESRSLTVADVLLDQPQPVIRVTKAMKNSREKGGYEYVGPPKSKASRRPGGLPPSAVQMLRPHLAGRPSSEPLFPGVRTEYMSHSAPGRAFNKGAAEARSEGELHKDPDLDSLRHTHASLMLAAGMETWKLANHLGHDETMTRKVYGHLMPEAQFEAATFAAKALDGGAILMLGTATS
ncbi:tyrosine-type recombinase/integrase [Nesterenkonia haasae]|uniref:tyrosine-type recombinase/integrase n=1 Tax=Nesterenkonia haasae TaxID=2587813 RepID=UPI001390CFBD|nr:site-specific integrase [Nesterenkonia haasae]